MLSIAVPLVLLVGLGSVGDAEGAGLRGVRLGAGLEGAGLGGVGLGVGSRDGL